jgi:hypothetical protein
MIDDEAHQLTIDICAYEREFIAAAAHHDEWCQREARFDVAELERLSYGKLSAEEATRCLCGLGVSVADWSLFGRLDLDRDDWRETLRDEILTPEASRVFGAFMKRNGL